MKDLIILEGIASTGKTTIEKLLLEEIREVIIITENETLIPLIDNKDVEVARVHLEKILNNIGSLEAQTIIVDRLHLTHAFRTSTSVHEFEQVEKYLRDHFKPLLVLLTIGEGVIESRIFESQEIRGLQWVKGKQGTAEEKVIYYTNQQRRLKELAAESTLPTLQLDTTSKEWGVCTHEIVSHINSY